ncbi:MAG: thymidylate kinase [Clostridia bacterium]
MKEQGYIIEFEGTDGSGKETQTKLIVERLKKEYKDKEVFIQDFPNYKSESAGPVNMYLHGELGEHANDLDAYQVSPLYAADRLCTYAKKDGFGEAYHRGALVILDRYTGSNLIHQACKIQDITEREKFLKWSTELEYTFMKLPKPDLVIFLDMTVEASQKLREERKDLKVGGAKDIHEQDKTHMTKAYAAGVYVAKKYNWEVVHCVRADKSIKTIEEIHEEIYNIIIEKIEK